mmetsp:Transcript_22087/g.39612  ORF Transcript_22087/g.39612 Transcript_22087/m.39612 type:complete len:81 (+) Transcript_22087:239-481(+)
MPPWPTKLPEGWSGVTGTKLIDGISVDCGMATSGASTGAPRLARTGEGLRCRPCATGATSEPPLPRTGEASLTGDRFRIL